VEAKEIPVFKVLDQAWGSSIVMGKTAMGLRFSKPTVSFCQHVTISCQIFWFYGVGRQPFEIRVEQNFINYA